TGQSFTYMMGHFPAPWGNELRAGPLEALFALTFSLVTFLSMTGGAVDVRRDIQRHRQVWYCLLMQLLYASLLAMVYTNDLFTAYVFIEIAAITACIAVVAKESGRSVVAAIRYLVFSCLGSGLILLGISILYCITGHLLMENLGQAVAQLADARQYMGPLTASALLLTLGLSIKSAQFPFHAWLPDAHASATTSASAILSGLVLKGYLVLLVKLIIRVFGGSLLIRIYMYDLLFFLGLAGMLFASIAALRQEEVKRMVAYSSSAQISYIFLALGLGSRAGVAAACFQILSHAFTKPMIFVGVGGMIRAANGGHYWSDLRGCAWKDPVAGIGFTVGGLSLCGLPLLAGFSAKYSLAVAALSAQWQIMPALFGLAISSVLNAMYYIPAMLAIWGKPDERGAAVRAYMDVREHQLSIGCFLVFNVVLGVAVGPILNLIYQGLELL
ncbi:MAG: proton-conducting transporter membrane subunit, partial [Lawsonibacter sp.]|nr:proton-conducting transporter membrane subunit [Lawsonibacter sp.]